MIKWGILSILTIIPMAWLASAAMDGWRYYLMGGLVLVYGIFNRLAGEADTKKRTHMEGG